MLSLQVKFLGTGTSTLTMMYQEVPEPDKCLGNQCAEGSTCVAGQFEYICQCPVNRGGRYCQGKIEEFFLSLNDEIQSLKQILDKNPSIEN